MRVIFQWRVACLLSFAVAQRLLKGGRQAVTSRMRNAKMDFFMWVSSIGRAVNFKIIPSMGDFLVRQCYIGCIQML